MSSIDSKPTVLTVHPSTPNDAVRSLEVRVRAEKSDMLVFHYSLAADLSRVRVPPPGVGRLADALWKHTCFEAFVAAADAPEISVRRCDGALELESAVRLRHLADLRDAHHLRVAMAAVIEDDAGGLS